MLPKQKSVTLQAVSFMIFVIFLFGCEIIEECDAADTETETEIVCPEGSIPLDIWAYWEGEARTGRWCQCDFAYDTLCEDDYTRLNAFDEGFDYTLEWYNFSCYDTEKAQACIDSFWQQTCEQFVRKAPLTDDLKAVCNEYKIGIKGTEIDRW